MIKLNILVAGLNRMYYDRLSDIFKVDIMTYSGSTDEVLIQAQLEEWENAGYLEILKPVNDCADREPCIRLMGPIPLPTKT